MATASSWQMQNTSRSKISIEEATRLAKGSLRVIGFNDEDADIVADHIMDTELRGHSASGLARIVELAEHYRRRGEPPRGSAYMTIDRETPSSVHICGNDAFGYLAGLRSAQLAISKAKASGGIAVAAVSQIINTGMLSYYAELCTAQDLVCLVFASSIPGIAPHGSFSRRFGTNPVCIGFPSSTQPVIWDIATSKITYAQLGLAHMLHAPLPPDTAYTADGEPTQDTAAAFQGGSLAVWGGFKGSGLAIAVQLLGALAGAPAHPDNPQVSGDYGHMIIAMDPEMFRPLDEFKKEVDSYAELVRSSKPLPGFGPTRMPFDRSAETRKKNRERGFIEVETKIIEILTKQAGL
ncbi:Malate/L-lactate dehydrogenase [Niveomyces insectorum RCEF 264]|uniref:Malate/L-lactate dehydrogenase n=1 Tax=Niveomyces insectorum RCEF 264 TaxID=1081102 RepID=A0A162L395_9HYPO|nr:Malate/L-lactate dehydrogenase [Niveomyces insectorum RCEF 264]